MREAANLRRAAHNLGIEALAGVSIDDLVTIAYRRGACGEIRAALYEVILGRAVSEPTRLQRAIISDDPEVAVLTDAQMKILDRHRSSIN